MEITAKVYKVGETQQVTDKFKKRELIVITEPNSQYPQHIKVQFSQDKCEQADSIRPGDECKFEVNLRGRLYTDKNGQENTVTNLEVWRVTKLSSASQPATTQLSEPEDDSLPF